MVYKRVASSERLRRLTSTGGRWDRAQRVNDSGDVGSMSRFVALDLEAGGHTYEEPKATLPLKRIELFLKRCCFGGTEQGRIRGPAIAVIALQAFIIAALLLHICLDAGGPIQPTESVKRVGERGAFLSGQDSQVFNHLIMVPGHGVTITESLDGADSRDADWFLLDYQKEKDVPEALVGHMRGGLDQLDADSASLLLFSGGKTRVLAGPKSEGESYFFVADHYDWWGKPDLRTRSSTEDFARDSFENILFSICRFKEITGNYPTKITIVGYDFKSDRFENLHRAALRFPSEHFKYIGLHPGGKFDNVAAEAGEEKSALKPYRTDPYGCSADGPLALKRAERDPFHRTPPYTLVCPEMRDLLEWCGPGQFEGNLPWSPLGQGG